MIAWSRAATHHPRHRRAGREGAGAAARPARRENAVTDAIRTPDVLLDGLPGFEWAPSFRTVGRAAARPRRRRRRRAGVMLHGEPTWSYLWRKVAPPVLEAGHRVILPDLPGLRALGQADRTRTGTPTTATRRRSPTCSRTLDLRDATFVLHDWGGPIGLRVAVEHAERVDAARADGHRPVHRRAADERRLAPLRGLRRPRRRAAGRVARAPRLRRPTRATRSPPPTTRRSRTRRARRARGRSRRSCR